SGVSKLFARARIAELKADFNRGLDADLARAQITDIALTHGLVSDYTSLVAVDRSENSIAARPQDEDLKTTEVPRHLPDGWSAEAIFGKDQQDGSVIRKAAMRQFDVAMMAGAPVAFPQTASAAPLFATLGGALMALGAVLGLMLRRRWV
ncbi:MAG: LPXTG cell wall anchor domain-containing protein, partial [Rhodospirillales bacterium]